MARKNQRLINFHTSGLTSMPVASDVHYGEIVVRHNKQQPELLIKVSESEFGVIPGSGAVASAISVAAKNVTDYIDGEVNTIESSITSLQKAVSAVSTNIGENYVSKTDFVQAQGDLFDSATTVASNDATTKANKAKEDAIKAAAASAKTLNSSIEAVDDRVDTVSGNLNSFKTDVANTYATKTSVTSDIATAKSEAISAAASDATEKANNAKSAAINAAAASADTLNKRIDTVDNKVGTLSGNVHTTITNVQTALTQTINNKVATAYRYKGSCTYAQLTGKTAEFTGEVWNVTDANGNFPAGTNYAWDGKKWDALGGSVDLSPYALKTEVTGATKTLQDKIDAANSKIDTVSTSLNTFKTTVADTYATKTDVASDIATAKSEAISAAASDATEKANGAKTAAINAAAASAKTLQNNIDAVNNSVTGLSASTVSIKATADKAVQTASIVDGATCKVSVSKVDTELKFDFRNIVIDCGDF